MKLLLLNNSLETTWNVAVAT